MQKESFVFKKNDGNNKRTRWRTFAAPHVEARVDESYRYQKSEHNNSEIENFRLLYFITTLVIRWSSNKDLSACLTAVELLDSLEQETRVLIKSIALLTVEVTLAECPKFGYQILKLAYRRNFLRNNFLAKNTSCGLLASPVLSLSFPPTILKDTFAQFIQFSRTQRTCTLTCIPTPA